MNEDTRLRANALAQNIIKLEDALSQLGGESADFTMAHYTASPLDSFVRHLVSPALTDTIRKMLAEELQGQLVKAKADLEAL